MLELTHTAARRLMLAAQGLLNPPPAPADKADILAAIQRMGALQIDTISVIARSPYMVLFSRLGDYKSAWLEELLEEGKLFEYWAHAACWLPIEDYPLYRRRMLDNPFSWWKPYQWLEEHAAVAEMVRTTIRERGPVRSADFVDKREREHSGWWNWKEEKLALEQLFNIGELMVARRQGFQRLYDLRERVLPDWDDSRAPATESVRKAMILKTVHTLGIVQAAWIPDYFRIAKTGIAKETAELAAAGELVEARVEGWKVPAYLHPEQITLAEEAANGGLEPTYTTLLSPFDPLVWDRARVRAMFDFNYTIECYVPPAKRQYGYYSLPVLHRGELVARLDAKAHRADKVFEVKAIHYEAGVEREAVEPAILEAVQRCADWHKTPTVRDSRTESIPS